MTDVFDQRVEPWRGLGSKIHSPLNSADAIHQAGLDWEVAQANVLFTPGESYQYNEPTLAKDYYVNYRTDTQEVLGIVGKKYEIVQNREAFQFIDDLVDVDEIKFVQGGPFGNGKKAWLLAQMPSQYVLGDRTDLYLCFVHGHDGNTGIKVFICADRFVCHNAIHVNFQHALRGWSTSHTAGAKDRLEHAKIAFQMTSKYLDRLKDKAERLYKVKLDQGKIENLTTKLFPYNQETATDRTIQNAINQRNEWLFRFKNAPDLENFRYTGWGFVTATADFATHAPPIRETKNFKENRFSKLIGGGTLVDKAVELIAA